MSNEQALQAVGQQIVAFLDDALAGRDHAHLRDLSDRILKELVDVLPEEDPGWTAGIETIAAVVANALQSRSDRWHEALGFIGGYFQSARVAADTQHPRVDRSFSIGTGASRRHLIRVDLAIPITRLVLTGAATSERQALFAELEDWDVLRNLAKVLASIDLAPIELSAFLRRVDPFTSRDMTRGEIFEKIHAWAGAHPSTARQIVDAWLSREPGYRELEISSISVLVEGVVACHGETIAWRNHVIDELVHRRDEESWQLAAYLACFAWPQDDTPDVTERHAELRKHVERLPERMVHTGLNAMSRDARDYPVEAIHTALELIALLPERQHEQPIDNQISPSIGLALALAEVVKRALWSLHQSEAAPVTPIKWAPVVDVLVAIPPEYARSLDGFLEKLARQDLAECKAFLVRWLETHAQGLMARAAGPDHLFPTFTNAKDQTLRRWLVDMAVAPRYRTRALAVDLLGRDNWIPDIDDLSSLSPQQARALAHELAGSNTSGDFWIPSLFHLGRACPEALPEVRDILLEEAALDYPGVCKQELALWNTSEQSALTAEAIHPLEDARQTLTSRLEERTQLHHRRIEVPEIVTTVPAINLAQEAHQRIMQVADERSRASGQFPLLSMLQQVPIARGQGTVHRIDDQVMQVPFATLSTEFEMPFLDSVDAATMAYRRLVHRNRAAMLLGETIQESEP